MDLVVSADLGLEQRNAALLLLDHKIRLPCQAHPLETLLRSVELRCENRRELK